MLISLQTPLFFLPIFKNFSHFKHRQMSVLQTFQPALFPVPQLRFLFNMEYYFQKPIRAFINRSDPPLVTKIIITRFPEFVTFSTRTIVPATLQNVCAE